VLVLLGITLFLVGIERGRDWVAGIGLLLVTIKPHISLLFMVAVLLWVVCAKRWTVIVFGFLSGLVTSFIILTINPHIFRQYWAHITVVAAQDYHFPNLGGMLYTITGWRGAAVLPEIVGLAWLARYWWFHRSTWDWKREGLIVLVVSVACSYYSFAYDEVILLPALLASAASGKRPALLGGLVLVNIGYAVYLSRLGGMFGLSPMFLWWTASAWLLTYLLSRPAHVSRVGSALADGMA
jgi:hypothetical protein